MSGYSSISSYLLAVKLRSSKTLLVEGASDKKVLSHFLLKKNYVDKVDSSYCIDDASLIDDKSLGPIGAKDKIKTIASKLSTENFRCFIDREWDGFDNHSMEYSDITASDNTFLTKGHSIENYWFTSQSFVDFVLHTHPTEVSTQYLERIEKCHIAMLQFAAAYSLACRDLSIVARANEMISRENITLIGEYFHAAPCINVKIANRGKPCNLADSINELVKTTASYHVSKLQWICHGHLGEQAIRSCIGKLAEAEGYNSQVIDSIEFGFKLEKLKLDSDHVTSLPDCVSTPLHQVLEWVRR